VETPEVTVLRVLQRLNLESRGQLLTLDAEEREAAYECLFDSALAAWPAGQPETDHPLSIVETILEGRGEFAWAAALYALLHDRRTGQGPLSRSERAVLRFKLGHVLFLLDEFNVDNIQRCLDFSAETLRQVEELWHCERMYRDALSPLIFELHSWMGHRYEAIGLYPSAEHAYSQAATAAQNTTDHVAYTVRAASVLESLGEKQKAYQLLLSVREQLDGVDEEDVRQLWEANYHSLRAALGGDLKSRPGIFMENLSRVYQDVLEDKSPGKNERLSQAVAEFQLQLREVPAEDLVLKHRIMTAIACLLFPLGRDAEGEELLRQAEALEDSFADELPKLERRILLARRQQHVLHDFTEARATFVELLPAGERLLDGKEKLAFYGFVLEALWAGGSEVDGALTLDLAAKGCALFESILDLQPGSMARRRVREECQRFFEGAFLALLSAAHKVGEDSAAGQEMLARAWSVAMAARNPELRSFVPKPAMDEMRRLRDLEKKFHCALRNGQDWLTPLKEVHEYELTILRASRSPAQEVLLSSPPSEGVSVVFFLLRDLVKQRFLAILGWREGCFTTHGINDADQSISGPLKDWSSWLSAQQGEVSRDVTSARSNSQSRGGESEPFEIGRLLPASLSPLLSRPAVPWFVFPDDELNGVPLEMLPVPGNSRFGQRRAVHLCLRPTGCNAWSRADFSHGWLGLGGAPEALGLPYLDKSKGEVVDLEKALRKRGYSATALTGPEATSRAFRKGLEERPGVLHFAVHGSASSEYPDACALILANDPDSPEGELFPFRRIRELDLSRVSLVVLSACRSLIGRSSRAEGMEGLAWAFLQAGATQVIASRIRVGDVHAAHFMTVLYEHLLGLPVAEALGQARDECLRQGMPPGQVGAWSVWC